MDLSSIEDAVAIAEQRWPGFEFRIRGNEAHGPCPICRQAEEDGFIIFENGGYWCRPGGCKGWLDENEQRVWTPEEIRLRRLEAEQNRQRIKERETERRLSALERMARCIDHITYHKLMDEHDREYWHTQGIFDEAIDRYRLGICYNCPTDRLHRPSYTIPVINRGKLVNIRHRLINVDAGDRYRPHMAGLGNTLFDADHLYNGVPEVMIVEGEKKSIVLGQYGFNAVGIMGKSAFPPAWATRFTPFERVSVCLDPDAQDRAEQIARLFSGRARVVTLPVKPDDFFVLGGKPHEFREYLKWARPIKAG